MRRCLALLVAGLAPVAVSVHYSCTGDDVQGELMGQTGVVCGPRCIEGSFECPSDVPAGTSAEPQCILQDIDQTPYCALFCESDMQCPSGSTCWRSAALEDGICMHPLSFSDWAQQGVRRKLDLVGVPTRAGSGATGFSVAKAYAALMSLKERFGIAEGDPDVVTVEEMLAVAHHVNEGRAPASPSTGAAGNSGPRPHPSVMNTFRRDMDLMRRAFPLERRMRQGGEAAWRLFRTFFLIAVAYFVGGYIYKSQALGADGLDGVPHIGLWREVADQLVQAAGLRRQKFVPEPDL